MKRWRNIKKNLKNYNINIEVNSFYDYADECKKYYSVHGDGHYYDTYEKALREELIALGLLTPKSKCKQTQSCTEIFVTL